MSKLKTLLCRMITQQIVGIVVILFVGPSQYASAEMVVIVHSSNSASFDDELIAQIFLGRTKTLPGNEEIIPVDQKEGRAVREEFGTKILKKTQSQLKAYWSRVVFTGGGVLPKQLENDEAVIEFIEEHPNAIGYIDSSRLSADVKRVR